MLELITCEQRAQISVIYFQGGMIVLRVNTAVSRFTLTSHTVRHTHRHITQSETHTDTHKVRHTRDTHSYRHRLGSVKRHVQKTNRQTFSLKS